MGLPVFAVMARLLRRLCRRPRPGQTPEQEKKGPVPIVEDGNLVGLITDRDLGRASPSILGRTSEDEYNQVFQQNTCVACHTIRGLSGATGTVGPDLTHLASRATLGAGVIDNTPDNVRAWISDVQAIKPGVLMPAFSSLPPADLQALTDYLAGLK